MPLKKARSRKKKSIQKAVSANIKELYDANKTKPAGKQRSRAQIQAIAYSVAENKGKKKKGSGSGDNRIK